MNKRKNLRKRKKTPKVYTLHHTLCTSVKLTCRVDSGSKIPSSSKLCGANKLSHLLSIKLPKIWLVSSSNECMSLLLLFRIWLLLVVVVVLLMLPRKPNFVADNLLGNGGRVVVVVMVVT